ncbi:hypothetical protein GQ54DRAFT_42203 [Martensiomyces pterosporus]|nr:hypothetical protein GQ54DRAFT_42203 [Martensiomyces pterosporus]
MCSSTRICDFRLAMALSGDGRGVLLTGSAGGCKGHRAPVPRSTRACVCSLASGMTPTISKVCNWSYLQSARLLNSNMLGGHISSVSPKPGAYTGAHLFSENPPNACHVAHRGARAATPSQAITECTMLRLA